MRMPQAFFVCVCLLGVTQLAWSQSQNKVPAIPGYYDPLTGQFTTHIASGAAHTDAQAALTGTSTFFREDFQVKIWNYDQLTDAQVTCSAVITTVDTNGLFEDSYSVPSVSSGGSWTCDVPVLTLWTLQNPDTDVLHASVSVTINGGSGFCCASTRTSSQSFSLTVPGNTQTIVNNVVFQL
jgi:hypothetical protein